jgi:hypothetical protein
LIAELSPAETGYRKVLGILRLTRTGAVNFDYGVDVTVLSAHLASCLRDVKADKIEVEPNRVSFRGGLFRLVGKGNVLNSFGSGEITIHEDTCQIRYLLSVRELAVSVTAMVLFMGVMGPLTTRDVGGATADLEWALPFFLSAGILAFFGGVAIDITRFRALICRALATAPRRV